MKRSKTPQSTELIRLNRYLSMCGISSRRKADELITEGNVRVNGDVTTALGTKINPRIDKVVVNGKQIVQVHDFVYLVMNKPKDTITTMHDEKGRTTVMSLLHSKQRVYPIGRLDRNTTGVLLFTNDGEFANRLMHPKHEVPKSYLVTCATVVKPEHIAQLRRGVQLKDGKTASSEVYVIPGGRGKEIGIIIHEGRNRQVRRMFEELEYQVKKLDRVAYGPVTKEGIARAGTRSLTRSEVRQLKRLAGMESEDK